MPANLTESPYLLALKALRPGFPQTGSIHLVGGAVRDSLLGRPVTDFDFTTSGDPTPLARSLARKVAGHWFWLDERRMQSRVISKHGIADFAPWRAGTLALDLAARDFSINAIALDLTAETDTALYDPLGGCTDLSARILRCAGSGVLNDDPLRVLKGIRHLSELGLSIAPSTLQAMRDAAPALTGIAPERVRIEFWRILTAQDAVSGLVWLNELGCEEPLLGDHCSKEVSMRMCHALEIAATALRALVAAVPGTAARLAEEVEQGLTRERLLLWHEVAAQIDPGLPVQSARAWRCGGQCVNRIAALSRFNLSPEHLATVPDRVRPLALWALQNGPDPRDIFYTMQIRYPADTRLSALIREIEKMECLDIWPPLVDGQWIADEFAQTGPAIGRALSLVRDAEIRGEVTDAKQARNFLTTKLSNCS